MTIILFDQFWYTDPDPGQAALKMKAMEGKLLAGRLLSALLSSPLFMVDS